MSNCGKCRNCGKTVYQLEAVTAVDAVFHKGCFKCDTCGWQLTLTSYKSFENKIYCKNHFPVTGFGDKHATGTEDLGGKQFVSPRSAPKLDVQASNVSKGVKDLPSPSTGLNDMTTKTAVSAPKPDVAGRELINSVVVHPLVLLSTVDHYYRVAKDTDKRVVGILLGEVSKGRVDITNSYAVPFEEDDRNQKIWFLDHNYHENMFAMFKKVTAREGVVGWYSSGPKLRENDLEIHEVIRRYTPNPVLVIIDVQLKEELEIPTKAYSTVEEVREDGTTRMKFQHLPSEIGAVEAEEVGVEHLLRDVKDTSISTLATRVNNKLLSLKSLLAKIHEMQTYLENLVSGKLPVNHQIVNQIQDIFNLLPNLSADALVRSFAVKTNDMMLAIYLSSLIRSVIALHNLLRNKVALRDAERKADAPPEEKKKETDGKADKDAKDGKDGKGAKPAAGAKESKENGKK